MSRIRRIQLEDETGTLIDQDNPLPVSSGQNKPELDPFGRLRVSEPYTIFDSKQLHDKLPLFWDESIGGSATSVHSVPDAQTVMSVTASASDYAIRQTKQRFNYQPGKGLLVFFTFLSSVVSGVTKRIGYFDDDLTGNNLTPNNGIYFETGTGGVSWNIVKDATTTQTAFQNSWSEDKLDGTGPSGITLDLDSVQIGVIDFEWLGVGTVRVGFVIDAEIIYCHYFNHANASYISVYMSTPNLPVRYTIESDGTAAGSLSHICSTVISEGGIEKTGVIRGIDTGTSFITNLATSNSYAVLGMRLKTSRKDITVFPEGLSVVAGTSDSFRWELQLNPAIDGTFTYSDVSDSAIQSATGSSSNTISTNGSVLSSGYASQVSRQTDQALETALRIGSTIAEVMDELVLVIRPLSNNLSIVASLNIRELL